MTDTGITDIGSAGAFAVAPDLGTDAYRQLSQLQDVVAQMVRQAKELGRSVPLGGGYAEEIGEFMASYGIGGHGSAVESLTRFGSELEDLKTQIAAALRRYQDADDDAADGVDCTGG